MASNAACLLAQTEARNNRPAAAGFVNKLRSQAAKNACQAPAAARRRIKNFRYIFSNRYADNWTAWRRARPRGRCRLALLPNSTPCH
jgi:hypothetical protein